MNHGGTCRSRKFPNSNQSVMRAKGTKRRGRKNAPSYDEKYKPRGVQQRSGNAFSLGDVDIAIHNEICKPVKSRGRSRPSNFQPIYFCSWSQAEHFSRIVRRKITASTGFLTGALLAGREPGELRTDCVPIATGSLQFNS